MPNESLTDALQEVYALAPNDVVALDTIEISYIGLSETLYLVQDRKEWDFTLEDATTHTFKPCGFRFIAPTAGKDGVQQMSLAVDNVGTEVTDFFEALGTELTEPVKVTYRPYLSNDTTQPQMNSPLVLFLVDIQMTTFEITGRATFSNIVNTKYPTDYYTAQRFPGLVGRDGNVDTPPSSSNAWDVVHLSFSNSFDISSEGDTPGGIFFKPDGTRMYTCIYTSNTNKKVQEYNLTTAWDVTTAVAGNSFSIGTYSPYAFDDVRSHGIFFKPDGLKMYVCNEWYVSAGSEYNTLIIEFDLSTAWDVTTAVFADQQEFFGDLNDTSRGKDVYFRSNGLSLFFVDDRSGAYTALVWNYNLNTAWDITDVDASSIDSFAVDTQDDTPWGFFFRDDGSRFYVTGQENDKLYQYDLSINWDITTAVYNSDSIDIGVADATAGYGPRGLFWKPDGLSAYVVRTLGTTHYVYQYDIT